MTHDTLVEIANIFCGNSKDLYKYKTGNDLVNFFNQYFDFKDKYGLGFPSRHIYAESRIAELFNNGKFESFLNLVLSQRYLMKDLNCQERDAYIQSEQILKEFNDLLKKDGYMIQKKDNKYFLIQEDLDLIPVGTGGFANVFKQKSTGFIIKKLKEEYWGNDSIVHRFKREFEITKSLSEYPFVIDVYNYESSNNSYSMEEAELTLEDYVNNNELSDEIKIKTIRQILHAMSLIHSKNIIHRDISPNNIFIIAGVLKIADFGLGKDLNVLNSHMTIHTNAVGQFAYCAPEQFMLLREGDKRSDVFSLGRLINFIMTKNPLDDKHEFRNLTVKSCSDTANYRYDDATELLDNFNKLVEYNADSKMYEKCSDDIKNGIYNDNVEQFISQMQSNRIVSLLTMNDEKIDRVFLKYMHTGEKHGYDFIYSIEESYKNMSLKFEDFDGIAYFANRVIFDDFDYLIKECACRILRYIAKFINRYYAQDLIQSILNNGIEPSLEEIFND